MDTDRLNAIRRDNLRRVMDEARDPARLSRKTGYSPHYLAALRAGRKIFTARAARRLEQRLKLPAYWFDEPHTGLPPAPDAPVYRLRMQAVTDALQELMGNGVTLTLTEYLDAVKAIYTGTTPARDREQALGA